MLGERRGVIVRASTALSVTSGSSGRRRVWKERDRSLELGSSFLHEIGSSRAVSGRMRFSFVFVAVFGVGGLLLPGPVAAAQAAAGPVPFEQIASALNAGAPILGGCAVAGRAAVRVRRDGRRPECDSVGRRRAADGRAHDHRVPGPQVRRERRRVVVRRSPAGVRHDRCEGADAKLQSRTSTTAAPARVLTQAKGPLSTPRWSPDGTRLAFLYSPGAPKTPSPLNPRTPDAGVVGGKIYEQRLAVIAVSGPSSDKLRARDRFRCGCLGPRRPQRLRVRLVRPTARVSPQPPRTATAMRTGGSPSSMRSTRRRASRRASIIPICRSPRRAGRATENGSPTSAAS